jgi:hypothetical protein
VLIVGTAITEPPRMDPRRVQRRALESPTAGGPSPRRGRSPGAGGVAVAYSVGLSAAGSPAEDRGCETGAVEGLPWRATRLGDASSLRGGIHRMMHPASPSARPHPNVRATPVDCRMDKRAFAARAVLGSAWQTESSVTASVEIGRLGLPKGGFSRTGRCSLGMEPNARGSWQGRRGGHRPCRSGSS